ncbi:MAG: hypothetical protein ABJA62_01155 [Luteimonas sp.]
MPAPANRLGTYLQCALTLLVLAAMYVVFEFVLPHVLPHPIHPDDYSNVSGGFADMAWRWKRPVSMNLIFAVAQFGPTAAYAVLSALAVLDAALALLFLGRMFAVRTGLLTTVVFGAIVFSHVSAFQHATYLGLLTNLISHLFGFAALFALLRGWRAGHVPMLVLAAGAYLLSAFAKEDFLLPPLLLIAFLAFSERNRTDAPASRSVRRSRWISCLAFAAICAGSLLWNAHVRSPFVAGLFSPTTSSAAYAVELSPRSLVGAYWTLQGAYAPFASLAALVACAWLWISVPRLRPHVLWYLATVAALILPYAVIPHNMPIFRTYAWLPWLGGIVAIALQVSMQRFADSTTAPRARFGIAVLSVVVATLLVWSHQAARKGVVNDYVRAAELNRRTVRTLVAQRAAVLREPAVGIVGLQDSSPWCANDAFYVNGKLGFRNKWIIFVPRETACYTQQARDVAHKRGINVAVVAAANLCGYGALPVLEYEADGSGKLGRASDYCGSNTHP